MIFYSSTIDYSYYEIGGLGLVQVDEVPDPYQVDALTGLHRRLMKPVSSSPVNSGARVRNRARRSMSCCKGCPVPVLTGYALHHHSL